MTDKYKKDTSFQQEERPIIELPQLIILGIIFLSFCFGVGLIIFPWYIIPGIFIVFAIVIGIFLNPYIGILIFLMGAIIHPAQIIGESVAGFHLARNLAFLMLFAWLFHILVYRDFGMIKSRQNWFVLGFGVMMLCSSLRHIDFSFPNFVELLKLLILYFMIINLVKKPKQVFLIVWFLIFLGLIAGVIGVYQYFNNIGLYSPEDGVLRITGTSLDPNDYAMHLVMIFPLLISLFFIVRNVIIRLILITTSILLLSNIIFTFSRGGFVGLGVVILFSFIMLIIQKRIKPVGVMILLISFILLLFFIPATYWTRMLTTLNPSEASASARLESWKAGLNMMKDHPIIGVGLGVFAYEYALRASIATDEFKVKIPRFAHNSYIQVGAEIGVIGLTFFLLLIFFSFRDISKAQRIFREKNEIALSDICQFLGVGLIGYAVCGMFLTQAYLTMFWIVVPLVVAMKEIALTISTPEEG